MLNPWLFLTLVLLGIALALWIPHWRLRRARAAPFQEAWERILERNMEMMALQQEMGMSVILITHNLGIIASLAQRALVMYAGRMVEEGPVETIFRECRHPYTWGLLQSVPRLDVPQRDLREIKGTDPRLNDLPSGCSFSSRCDFVMDLCRQEEPAPRAIGPGHLCRCWLKERPW